MCGTTHKTVKRIIEAHEAAGVGGRPMDKAPPAPSRPARSAAHQLPGVPGFTPRSRATAAIGFPLSATIRTAPARKLQVELASCL